MNISMMKKSLILFSLFCLVISCVPRKDLVYLQGQPMSKKDMRELNDQPYRLRVHDRIKVDIRAIDPNLVRLFNSEGGSLSSDYPVDRHGNVRLPYLGEINVLGYTLKEVRYKIEQKLLTDVFKNDNDLFVSVDLAGFRYTIMGEVGSPGPKTIEQSNLSIIQAITNAGDITTVGNRKNVEVIRFTPEGTKKFEIDLTQISSLDSEVFFIKPNDYINVKPLKQKSWGTGTTGLGSLTTIISVFTLVTSTILIVRGL